MPDDSALIARIDQKVINMADWQEHHDEKDDARFEKMFNYIKDRHDKTDQRIEELTRIKNESVGAGKILNYLISTAIAFIAAAGAVKIIK